MEYDEQPVEPLDKEEGYEELEDPESRKNAQLPDVDPSKIKVEQRDLFGKSSIIQYIILPCNVCNMTKCFKNNSNVFSKKCNFLIETN